MVPAPIHTMEEQEKLVLDAAAHCIEQSSLLDFTMAAIAKKSGLSMGSVYKHVHSKEDLLVALSVEVSKEQYVAFDRILSLSLTLPERLISTILLCPDKLQTYPFGQHLEMLVGNSDIVARASANWCDKMSSTSIRIEGLFREKMADAVATNELRVAPEDGGRTINMLLLGLWSMSVGFTQVAYQRHSWKSDAINPDFPFPLSTDHPIVEAHACLINSFDWKEPLTAEGIEKAKIAVEELGYRTLAEGEV